MGIFQWSHSHQRQGSDNKHIIPPDWFNKSSAEPSRHALNELVKEQLAAEFDRDPAYSSSRTRSRSGTVSSVRSHYAKSSTDRSAEIKSRPQSRQSIIEESPPSPSRTEPVSRGLFSKGSRIMRRKTSKLTLLPSQVEEPRAERNRQEFDPSKLELASQILNLSPKRAPTVKPSISGPFGFQHVTHTDQGQFQSLNSATRTDFISEFSALQAGQQPAAQIKGIPVSDLPTSPQGHARSDAPSLPSPTSSIVPDLPMTPPRPEPPPKDGPTPATTPNIRLSRLVENFSRPTRSPVSGVDISPISEHPADFEPCHNDPVLLTAPPSPMSWAEATNDTLTTISTRGPLAAPPHVLDKPLPLPPTLVHAVSTADDSALPLRTAPLPQLPLTQSPAAEVNGTSSPPTAAEQRPGSAHRSSLRHMQTFPSAKAARRRSQSSGEITLGSTVSSFGLLSPVQPLMPKPKNRVSIGIKKIDIEDWEDAIDYSWDHPPDLDDGFEASYDQFEMLHPSAAITKAPTVSTRPAHSIRSKPVSLTPVMEDQGFVKVRRQNDLVTATSGYTDIGNNAVPLQGLGIESLRPVTAYQVETDAGSDRGSMRESLRIPGIRRDPGSPMSKSSSQESIILSIASSIMGTHRSSNSSTSLSDMGHLASIEDESSILQATNEHRADSLGGNVSDSSQDTVTTEPKSVNTPATEPPSPPAGKHCLPSQNHERGISVSRVQVPNRTSSIMGSNMLPSNSRQRSSTLNGRPKNVRVSYSLFPTAQPLPPTT